MPSHTTSDPFVSLATLSRALHGHMYVLPVASWMRAADAPVVEVKDVMVGLEGRADRARVIEALARLTEIGALRERSRLGGRKNSPRSFERVPSPYWELVDAYSASGASEVSGVGS